MKLRTATLIFVLSLGVTPLFGRDVILTKGVPADVNMSEEILKAGVKLFEDAVEKDELRGVVLLVARDGKVVLHEAIGWKNKEKKLPMEKDVMFRMASNTKAIIATAIAISADEKKLSFDDNVRKYIPSFDNYRSGYIKVRHLLSHTGGLRISPIFIKPLIEKSPEHPNAPNLQLEVDRFGKIGADEFPPALYQYSNPGYNTLGALVEIVWGKELEVFLKERIYEPLGMVDSYNHETAEKLDGKLERMSVVYKKKRGKWTIGWKPGDEPSYPFVRASGGAISTAWDFAIFCQMFLNGGIYNGKQILKPQTVKKMVSKQSVTIYPPEKRRDFKKYYGFGWFVGEDGVFSHSGSDGTFAWIDPNNRIIGLVFTQSPGRKLANLREQFMKVVDASICKR